jgi:hypothetical protein
MMSPSCINKSQNGTEGLNEGLLNFDIETVTTKSMFCIKSRKRPPTLLFSWAFYYPV